MKKHIKETRSYHHAFLFFFMCDDLSLINTTQNSFKPFEKVFQCLGWMRKNFIHGSFSWSIAAETWDASCFKKGLEKPQSVPNTCTILPLKKIFYQNLTVNRWIFQIPLKYILFMLVLCSFNFYFKIPCSRPFHSLPPSDAISKTLLLLLFVFLFFTLPFLF